MKNALTFIFIILSLLVISGCKDSSGAGDSGRTLRIELLNPIQGFNGNAIEKSTEGQLVATYINDDTGEEVNVTSEVEWSSTSDDTQIINGVLTATGDATHTTVSARYLNAYSSNQIEVEFLSSDGGFTNFNIQPGLYHIQQGGQLQYISYVEFDYQGQRFKQDVTTSSTWSTQVIAGENQVVICNMDSQHEVCEGKTTGLVISDALPASEQSTAIIDASYESFDTSQQEDTLYISDEPPYENLEITLSGDDTMYIGQTQQLHAVVTDKENKTQDVTSQILWHSVNPDIVSVNDEGLIYAKSDGTVSIEARISDSVADSVSITVLDHQIVSIDVEGPLELTLPENMRSNETYQVTALYEDGNELPLTSGVTYTSTDYHVAKALSEGQGSDFYIQAGKKIGSAQVTARFNDELLSQPIDVQVVPLELTGLELKGLTNEIVVGEIELFEILAVYNNGYSKNKVNTNAVVASFNGQETSPHLAYGGSGTEHQLEGLSPTSDGVQVAFVYVDLDTGDTASTDIAVSVVATDSAELTLPFDSFYTEQTLILPESLSRSETGFNKVRWELSEPGSAVLSQNKRHLIPLSSSPVTLIAITSALEQYHFDLMPTSSPIVDIELIHQAPLNHMMAIAHHQDGATTDATNKVKWHSDAKEILAVDQNGRLLPYQDGQVTIQASLGAITSSPTVLSISGSNIHH